MENIHKSYGIKYNLTAYPCLKYLLKDVWLDAFVYWDSRIATTAAEDMATRAQDHAEIAWTWFYQGEKEAKRKARL